MPTENSLNNGRRKAQSRSGNGSQSGEDVLPQTPSSAGTPAIPVLLADVLEKTRRIGMLDDELVEVILATYISKEIEKRNPIWIMLVGNPSSNKTQLVSLLSKAEETIMIDVLTTNPFISGLSKKDKPQDLLPKLNGKCFIVKDYTSFFGRSEETVKQLLSDLVSIYDGTFCKHSGARGTVSYNSSFSHIGCVTPLGLSQRQRYMNMVGARFLTIRIPELTQGQRTRCFDIAWADDLGQRVEEASIAASKLVTSLCLEIRTHGVKLAPTPIAVRDELNLLSQLVARARGEVQSRSQTFTNEDDEVKTYEEIEEVQIEEPFRALNQLKALTKTLARLRGKKEETAAEISTVKRVALSSMPGNRAEVLSAFTVNDTVTAKVAAELLRKNYRTVKRHLDQLVHLQVLCAEKDVDGKTRIYSPHPQFRTLITTIQI